MKKLEGRDMIHKLEIAKKVNEVIEVLTRKGIFEEELDSNILLKRMS